MDNFAINHVININDDTNISDSKILILASRVHEDIVSRLIQGALRACYEAQLSNQNIFILRCDGALELPILLKMAASNGRFNAFVTLGCILKGHTDHYDHVARSCHEGILGVALKEGLPLGNGVLTVHQMEHAQERAVSSDNNAGFGAARAALDLLRTAKVLAQLAP